MNRRKLLLTISAATLCRPALDGQARAAAQPWIAQILNGGMSNGDWQLGLGIVLQPKWKTYWRVPGDGGVPPDIQVKGSNVKSFRFDCPTPLRMRSEAGEAIGYEDEVVFPVTVSPVDASKPLDAEISAFLGVCLEVCIPAQLHLRPTAENPQDAARLGKWRALIPDASVPFVSSAKALNINGKPAIRLELNRPVEDLFVEGQPLHYFKAPVFDGTSATIPVAGARNMDDLKLQPLRLTARLAKGGLEQMVTVA